MRCRATLFESPCRASLVVNVTAGIRKELRTGSVELIENRVTSHRRSPQVFGRSVSQPVGIAKPSFDFIYG